MKSRGRVHFEYLHCVGLPPLQFKERREQDLHSVCGVCVCVRVDPDDLL